LKNDSLCQGLCNKFKLSKHFLTSSCPVCGGEGKIVTKKCHVCSGSKISSGKDFLVIVIEKGVVHGHVYEYQE
jgi:DnaJ-class molecular chaperone